MDETGLAVGAAGVVALLVVWAVLALRRARETLEDIVEEPRERVSPPPYSARVPRPRRKRRPRPQ